jgi:hypothetical protein
MYNKQILQHFIDTKNWITESLMLSNYFRRSMDHKQRVNKKQNTEIDSAASSGVQGEYIKYISIIGPTRCTKCFQFIIINSLYMFRTLICSSSGGTVYTIIGIFCVYYVGWLLAHNTHKIFQLLYIQCVLMMSK